MQTVAQSTPKVGVALLFLAAGCGSAGNPQGATTPGSDATPDGTSSVAPEAGPIETDGEADVGSDGHAQGGATEAGTSDSAAPPGAVAIASGLNYVQSIVADDVNVYWIDELTTPVVRFCPAAGCGNQGPTTLPGLPSGATERDPSSLQRLVVAGGTPYFAYPDGPSVAPDGGPPGPGVIYSCPSATCATLQVFSPAADPSTTELAADATDLYWANATTGIVQRCALGSTCASPSLVADLSAFQPGLAGLRILGIAVSGGTVYLGVPRGPASALVYSVPVSGGSPVILCGEANQGPPTGLDDMLVFGTSLYFTDGENGVFTCSTTTLGQTHVTTYSGPETATALATDGTYLYWTDPDGAFTWTGVPRGAVKRCALGPTCTSPTTPASGQTILSASADGVAVGQNALFWATQESDGSSFSVERLGK